MGWRLTNSDIKYGESTLESYFTPLIGPNLSVVTGTELENMIKETSTRPNWRRVILDLVETCTTSVDYDYAYNHIMPQIAPDRDEGKLGLLILMDKDEWNRSKDMSRCSYAYLAYERMNMDHPCIEAAPRKIRCNQDIIYYLSVVCSRRAAAADDVLLAGRKALGSYLIAIFILASFLRGVSCITLEVQSTSYPAKNSPYGSCSPLRQPLRLWYERLGFVEEPRLALGAQLGTRMRGNRYKPTTENSLVSGNNLFLRTMSLNLLYHGDSDLVGRKGACPITYHQLVTTVTGMEPYPYPRIEYLYGKCVKKPTSVQK